MLRHTRQCNYWMGSGSLSDAQESLQRARRVHVLLEGFGSDSELVAPVLENDASRL